MSRWESRPLDRYWHAVTRGTNWSGMKMFSVHTIENPSMLHSPIIVVSSSALLRMS